MEPHPELCRVNKTLTTLHDRLQDKLESGILPRDLESFASDYFLDQQSQPAFPGYNGYEHVLSVAVNDEVAHVPPVQRRPFRTGDLVTIDCAARLNGWHADLARTHAVQPAPPGIRSLASAPDRALDEVSPIVQGGASVEDISRAIYKYGRSRGLGVVTFVGGHAIGKQLHADPRIPNAPSGTEEILEPGTAVALEPIYTLGKDNVEVLEDGWTIRTENGTLSAHSENVLFLTEEHSQTLGY